MGNTLTCAGKSLTCAGKKETNITEVPSSLLPDKKRQKDQLNSDVHAIYEEDTQHLSHVLSETNLNSISHDKIDEASDESDIEESHNEISDRESQTLEDSTSPTAAAAPHSISSPSANEAMDSYAEDSLNNSNEGISKDPKDFYHIKGLTMTLGKGLNPFREIYAALSLVNRFNDKESLHFRSKSFFRESTIRWNCNILLPFHEDYDVVLSLVRNRSLKFSDTILGQYRIAMSNLQPSTLFNTKMITAERSIYRHYLKHEPTVMELMSGEESHFDMSLSYLSMNKAICGYLHGRTLTPGVFSSEAHGKWSTFWASLIGSDLILYDMQKLADETSEAPVASTKKVLDLRKLVNAEIFLGQPSYDAKGHVISHASFALTVPSTHMEFGVMEHHSNLLKDNIANTKIWKDNILAVASQHEAVVKQMKEYIPIRSHH